MLVGHWLLAYVEMFLRDIDRLQDCRKRVNRCPLGCGAVAGSTLQLDRNVQGALMKICQSLAEQIVRDGEGLRHVIRLTIDGARNHSEAMQVARAIAYSPLCKTAWAGADPNWGRILASVGPACPSIPRRSPSSSARRKFAIADKVSHSTSASRTSTYHSQPAKFECNSVEVGRTCSI